MSHHATFFSVFGKLCLQRVGASSRVKVKRDMRVADCAASALRLAAASSEASGTRPKGVKRVGEPGAAPDQQPRTSLHCGPARNRAQALPYNRPTLAIMAR
jgi:hypothetical protein